MFYELNIFLSFFLSTSIDKEPINVSKGFNSIKSRIKSFWFYVNIFISVVYISYSFKFYTKNDILKFNKFGYKWKQKVICEKELEYYERRK